MENKKEMTAFGSSVGADERQPIQKCNNNSITLKTAKFNIIVEKGQNKRMNRYPLIAIQLFGEFVNGI